MEAMNLRKQKSEFNNYALNIFFLKKFDDESIISNNGINNHVKTKRHKSIKEESPKTSKLIALQRRMCWKLMI